MVCKLSLICFSLVIILQLQLNSNVECRPFKIDDLKEYVKAQARSRENIEFHKYIMFIKTSFTQGTTAHLTAFDNLILELYLHTKIEKKRLAKIEKKSKNWNH